MDLAGVIDSFLTGTYTVTRSPPSEYVDGRLSETPAADPWLPDTGYHIGELVSSDGRVYECVTEGISASSGGPTGATDGQVDGTCEWDVATGVGTFTIDACVQPVTGRELQRLPEGLRGREARSIWTATELLTVGPNQDPDSIEIDGESWVVQLVQEWSTLGGYWKVIALKAGN